VRLKAPREGYDNTLGERFLKLGFGFNEIVCLEHGLVDGGLRLVRPIVLCFRNGRNGPGCGRANGLVGGHGLAGSEDHAEDSSGTFDASRGLLVAQEARAGGFDFDGDERRLDAAHGDPGLDRRAIGQVPLSDDPAGHVFAKVRHFHRNRHAQPPRGVIPPHK
jgi:hypothetical protein